jgi:putative Ca2+/H+ antiporter (TMEM165/GDT1 family)
MEAFLISTGVVTLGEMGDKTQLLAFLLAAKFKRPLPIILGIFTATVLNHAAAGAWAPGSPPSWALAAALGHRHRLHRHGRLDADSGQGR